MNSHGKTIICYFKVICVNVCVLNMSMLYNVFICIIFTYILQLTKSFNRIVGVHEHVISYNSGRQIKY